MIMSARPKPTLDKQTNERFLNDLGLFCKVPMDADEDDLIRRCDVSAGVTRIDLIDRHYSTGHVDKATCEEFCRVWDEYKRRMEGYWLG